MRISLLLTCPQEPQGCQKKRYHLLNMPREVWCAKIDPQIEGYSKNLQKTGLIDNFFSLNFGSFLAHQTSSGMFSE